MHWELSGADRASGQERKITIEADDEASARRRANRQGLLVADVRQLELDDSTIRPAQLSRDAAPLGKRSSALTDPLEEHLIFETSLHPLRVFLVPVVACFVLVGFVILPFAYLRFRFNRFIITSKRITIRRGWLTKNTFEMLLAKVESVRVEQGLIDRLLGSGTVIIFGTGGSREVFPGIRGANRFRELATESIERYVSRR